MSPSWRDGLSIAVAPDEVRVRRHHRGWRRRSDAPVRVTVAAGDGLAAACMTAFCVVLFVYLLNLPFQLWPRF